MVFPHLTGSPSARFDHDFIKDENYFWNLILGADDNNYVITASTFELDWQMPSEQKKSKGIVSAHAYAVISLHEFDRKDEKIRLLKLRNPMASSEWTGDWSDDSDKWDKKTRALVNSVVKDDGIFFIAIEDYLEHFRGT